MDDRLQQIAMRLWRSLSSAAADKEHPWNQLVFTTVGTTGAPRARYLILREVHPEDRLLRFHTDIRSRKWQQLTNQPEVEILGYDAGSREQVRLSGRARPIAPGDDENSKVWNSLPLWTRTTYCGGPPGHATPPPVGTGPVDRPPTQQETEAGRDRFGLVDVTIERIDWYQHQRGDIRRAVFEFAGGDRLTNAQWVAP